LKKFWRIVIWIAPWIWLSGCGAGKTSTSAEDYRPEIAWSRSQTDSLFEKLLKPVRNEPFVKKLYYKGLVKSGDIKLPLYYFRRRNHSVITAVTYEGKTVYPVYYSHDRRWKWTGEQYDTLSPPEAQLVHTSLQSDWYLLPFYLYRQGERFQMIRPEQMLNGQPVMVLQAENEGGTWRFYFDRKHHLLVKLERIGSGKADFEMEFMDFRPVGDMEFPFYWLIYLPGRDRSIKAIWKEIEINPDMSFPPSGFPTLPPNK